MLVGLWARSVIWGLGFLNIEHASWYFVGVRGIWKSIFAFFSTSCCFSGECEIWCIFPLADFAYYVYESWFVVGVHGIWKRMNCLLHYFLSNQSCDNVRFGVYFRLHFLLIMCAYVMVLMRTATM